YQERVIGKRSWSLTFTTPFHPTGVAASAETTATGGAIHTMLKAVMGGEYKGRGTTAGGNWASSASGAVATSTNLRAGGVLAWADTAGIVHAREIEQVTTGAVVLKAGL